MLPAWYLSQLGDVGTRGLGQRRLIRRVRQRGTGKGTAVVQRTAGYGERCPTTATKPGGRRSTPKEGQRHRRRARRGGPERPRRRPRRCRDARRRGTGVFSALGGNRTPTFGSVGASDRSVGCCQMLFYQVRALLGSAACRRIRPLWTGRLPKGLPMTRSNHIDTWASPRSPGSSAEATCSLSTLKAVSACHRRRDARRYVPRQPTRRAARRRSVNSSEHVASCAPTTEQGRQAGT